MENTSTTIGLDGDEALSGFEEVSAPIPRKLTSTVWNSFKKFKKPNGEIVATCNHCGVNLVGDCGTTHLRNHLKRKHATIDASLTSDPVTYKFDQERTRQDLATMIIKHNYPLSIVEHEWFQIYSHGLNPEFKIISRNTIRSDIMSIHKEEKVKMYAFLESLSCKYYYINIYGHEGSNSYIARVCEAFRNLYQEYNNASHDELHKHGGDGSSMRTTSNDDKFGDFDDWCEQECPLGRYQKSEVDTYLEDPLFLREDNFCVLHWWKTNAAKYLVLAKIARDVLAVPATTVASESAFSVGGRKINETRASMLPELVEALVTTDDWIESGL